MHPILAERSRLVLYLTGWTPVVGLVGGLLSVAHEASWHQSLVVAAPLCLIYAFICLGAWYPCRALPLSRTGAARAAVTHLISSAASAGLWVALAWALARMLESSSGWQAVGRSMTAQAGLLLGMGFLLYLLSVTVHYLIVAFEASREAERRALSAEISSREAELQALKAQLDPHFLFNSLNSISSLITADPASCRDMCIELGAFLRGTLVLGRKSSHTVTDELAQSRRYLRVERARFGERLRVVEQISPECEDLQVPPLILQPLVENALKHGINGLINGGTITISAGCSGRCLTLAIENPFDTDAPQRRGAGVGLENVRRRLETDLGHEAEMKVSRIESAPGGQEPLFRVELRLPVATDARSWPDHLNQRETPVTEKNHER